MKKTLVLSLLTLSLFASAEPKTSDNVETVLSSKSSIEAARVAQLIPLFQSNETGLSVNLVVEDLGGSTDVSPTQRMYFTLYVKGEMYSTDASFPIGTVFTVKGAKRVARGIYEIRVVAVGDGEQDMQDKTLTVNATKAIDAIKAVNCGDEFDCDASTNFASEVTVTWK